MCDGVPLLRFIYTVFVTNPRQRVSCKQFVMIVELLMQETEKGLS
jgi:hypothetical protein